METILHYAIEVGQVIGFILLVLVGVVVNDYVRRGQYRNRRY